jgi:threonine dehydrogenase-like Zn-dependent dehydrogenase
LGAAAVIDPREKDALKNILDLTGGVGVDKAVDCSGVPAAQRLAVDAARRRGHVAFVGQAGEFPIHIGKDMIVKGLTLHGIWHYNLADTPKIMQVIKGSAKSLDKLVTHTFPLGQVKEALELQVTHDCGKVLLYPWR